jgi:hypothetical protein
VTPLLGSGPPNFSCGSSSSSDSIAIFRLFITGAGAGAGALVALNPGFLNKDGLGILILGSCSASINCLTWVFLTTSATFAFTSVAC